MRKKLIIIIVISSLVISAGIISFFSFLIITSLYHKNSFDSRIQGLMANNNIPSLVGGIVINDSLIWAKGYGEQPSLDTVYMIGSITKTFTSTAILQLNESGLLDFNEDINNYLPFDVRNPNYPSRAITPYMLLTHTAGLPTNLYWSLEFYFDNQTIDWINNNIDLGGGDIIKFEDRPSLGEFLNESLNPEGEYYDSYNWQSRPGSEFLYSNAGFQLLGYLIEEITNQSYIDYIQEHICEPLNMTNTGEYYTDFGENNAIPYERHNATNIEYPIYNLNVTGAGNLRSTIGDMANYLITFMNQGKYNENQILSSQSVDLMHYNHIPLSGTSTEGFTINGYGLGWFLFSDNVKGHGGATPGFSTNIYFKETNEGSFGVILMFNRGSALVYDSELINNFLPQINALFFEEAENLFQESLSH
ncbi:MAG: serine hydrolase domain-containing protein [Promethearchaeota archaeon]